MSTVEEYIMRNALITIMLLSAAQFSEAEPVSNSVESDREIVEYSITTCYDIATYPVLHQQMAIQFNNAVHFYDTDDETPMVPRPAPSNVIDAEYRKMWTAMMGEIDFRFHACMQAILSGKQSKHYMVRMSLSQTQYQMSELSRQCKVLYADDPEGDNQYCSAFTRRGEMRFNVPLLVSQELWDSYTMHRR